MEYIVTRQEMQAIDSYSISKIGIPAEVLMERAALEVVRVIEKVNVSKGRILIVVEIGNNGGDGLAAARILLERGYLVDIYHIGGIKKQTKQFQTQMNILHQLGVRLRKSIPHKD